MTVGAAAPRAPGLETAAVIVGAALLAAPLPEGAGTSVKTGAEDPEDTAVEDPDAVDEEVDTETDPDEVWEDCTLEMLLEASFGKSVVVIVDVAAGMIATVTVTVEVPLVAVSVLVLDAVAAETDTVPVEEAVAITEVEVELVASAPVIPPVTPQAAMVDSTVL